MDEAKEHRRDSKASWSREEAWLTARHARPTRVRARSSPPAEPRSDAPLRATRKAMRSRYEGPSAHLANQRQERQGRAPRVISLAFDCFAYRQTTGPEPSRGRQAGGQLGKPERYGIRGHSTRANGFDSECSKTYIHLSDRRLFGQAVRMN